MFVSGFRGLAEAVRLVSCLITYLVSHLSPRKRSIWVFSSKGGTMFTGNAKYLYLFLYQHANHLETDLRPIFLLDDDSVVSELEEKGYRAYQTNSLRGVYATLRAKYVFGTVGIDVPWWLTGGATIVQLWHSAAIKTFGWDKPSLQDGSLRSRFYHTYIDVWDYLIVTSDTERVKMASAYRMEDENIWVTGYPRNDVLFTEIDGADIGVDQNWLDEVRELPGDKTRIGYFPTWRSGDVKPADELANVFDPSTISTLLENNNAYLILKLHPNTADALDLNPFDRIVELPQEMDIMLVLEYIDVLITDFSSVYVDYLLLDRPVVFYPYDLDEYIKTRPLYHDFEEITPGPLATELDELCSVLESVIEDEDSYVEERERVRSIFFEHCDGDASKRVFERVNGLYED